MRTSRASLITLKEAVAKKASGLCGTLFTPEER